MAYEERYKPVELPHNVIMENRKKLSVSGVEDVGSFDEGEIVMTTTQGTLVLHGRELKIEKLSLDTGDVVIGGDIDSLQYEDDERPSGGGLFTRLFK